MPPKGISNNPAGRPTGTPNKTTAEIKGVLSQFISRNIENMQRDFDTITDPCMRLHFMEKLLKYIIPARAPGTVDIDECNAEMEAVVKSLADSINARHELQQTIPLRQIDRYESENHIQAAKPAI